MQFLNLNFSQIDTFSTVGRHELETGTGYFVVFLSVSDTLKKLSFDFDSTLNCELWF